MLTGLAAAGVAGGTLSAVALWGVNYRRKGDARKATRKTSRRIVALVATVVSVFVIAVGEFVGIFGILGDLVATFPGGFSQAAIGLIAILGVSGWIELTVVGMTVLVVLAMAVSAAINN